MNSREIFQQIIWVYGNLLYKLGIKLWLAG